MAFQISLSQLLFFLSQTALMAEDIEELKHEGEVENPKPVDKPAAASSPAAAFPAFSVNIWPPSQRTRDAVINRLIENLSTPSILSKRYGTMPSDEASAVARRIEQEAFDLACTHVSPPSDAKSDEVDEGIEILQVYSKEISRRMIDSVKTKGSDVSRTQAEDNAARELEGGGDLVDSVGKPNQLSGEEILLGESEPSGA